MASEVWTVEEWALVLGVSPRRARLLAQKVEGAEKRGRDWLIPKGAQDPRQAPGRPPGGASTTLPTRRRA